MLENVEQWLYSREKKDPYCVLHAKSMINELELVSLAQIAEFLARGRRGIANGSRAGRGAPNKGAKRALGVMLRPNKGFWVRCRFQKVFTAKNCSTLIG